MVFSIGDNQQGVMLTGLVLKSGQPGADSLAQGRPPLGDNADRDGTQAL